jgi:hypothetical protein
MKVELVLQALIDFVAKFKAKYNLVDLELEEFFQQGEMA